ncbi:hypothetical protein [Sabulicella rubraurantiaca]|uniref:hypothetical protein n=1 Tax=Sabulicella rubraurantiaca TaxID=2811429 RepID=UPI001A96077C|nr:hypothetical protein [Sabulicella rubraurantiaca]
MRGLALLLALFAAGPAPAQQRVVVSADSAVVAPARGAEAAPMVAATRPRLTGSGRRGGPATSRAEGGDATLQSLAVPALVGLPLAAAAGALIAGAASGNSVFGTGSATTAPARAG